MPTTAKTFEYALSLDRAGRVAPEGDVPLELPEAWTPEHLVLAGLLRCSVQSLRFHAARSGIDLLAHGHATSTVTKRDEDGRYAFVRIECELDVELEPEPPGDEISALVAKAERDCFVGASLTAKPTYRWRVNGTEV